MLKTQVSLSAEDNVQVLDEVLRQEFLPADEPEKLLDGADRIDIDQDWKSRLLSFTRGSARWPDGSRVSFTHDHVVKVQHPGPPSSVADLVSFVLPLSFLLSTCRTHGLAWHSFDYSAPGFAELHFPHGFACAFKGAGHDRLVSRRWLKYGPWRLIRDEENDFSFIQFHDLNADAETALEQAKPGHQRMGISREGGFLQGRYVYNTDFDGLYVPEDEVLEIVVHGRKIPDVEMRDACALRHYQDLGDDKPLKNVRYVFVGGEQQAREYLHELWLRELECWAIVDGDKVRLDEDYEPPAPEKPEWVTKIEDEEAG